MIMVVTCQLMGNFFLYTLLYHSSFTFQRIFLIASHSHDHVELIDMDNVSDDEHGHSHGYA